MPTIYTERASRDIKMLWVIRSNQSHVQAFSDIITYGIEIKVASVRISR
jgi:hypothetical protein